jgi:hypothetical protein
MVRPFLKITISARASLANIKEQMTNNETRVIVIG